MSNSSIRETGGEIDRKVGAREKNEGKGKEEM
jgi:hypothetical protein